jgi:hypothetical protein
MKDNGIISLKPNIQLFAEPATPATPASCGEPATPAVAEPPKPGSTPAEPLKPFKSFASQADYDREIQQALKTHEEKLKSKLTPEIRKQLEAEANMTADQKVQAQLDQIAAEKKEIAKERVRIKVESLFASKGISEADRQTMLDSIVDDDEDGSMKRGQALISAIEHDVNEKIKAAMKKVTPPDGGGEGAGKGKDKAVEYAKSLADRRAASMKASHSALDFYINGGK